MNRIVKIFIVVILLTGTTVGLKSCKKQPQPNLPVVTTTSVTDITLRTAKSGGNVTGDGGAVVTDRGICWNISENPDTTNMRTYDDSGTGIFISSLGLLTPGTLYYVRAYASNFVGTAYGNQVSFTTRPKQILPIVFNPNLTSSLIPLTKNWQRNRKSENGTFSKLIINYISKQMA